jgi:hypothetical protein
MLEDWMGRYSLTTLPLRYFQTLMNLVECMEIAKSEAGLTRFHYAFTAGTDIKNAEGYLIAKLKEREYSTACNSRRVRFGNDKFEGFDKDAKFVQSFLLLNEPEAQRGTLAYILGE